MHQPTLSIKSEIIETEFHKFANINVMDIQHLLRYMGSSDKTEFSYCLDKKRSCNDCKIVSELDNETRLQSLQHNFNEMKQRFEELRSDYNNIYDKYEALHKEYQSNLSLKV